LSVLAPQDTVMVLPPWMLLGTEMLLGVVGAVFVDTEPSSETKREEGSIKAGRMPYVLEQLLLFQLPLEFTFCAFVAPLLELQ